MKTYKEIKQKFLKHKEVRRVYDALGPEFALIEMIIERRLKRGLTQAQLAQKIGTKQTAIARLESGTYNPTVKFLNKVAKALGATLSLSIR